MRMNEFCVIGVMSGTSLDGLDLCCVNFILHDDWTFKIIASETISYSNDWVMKLQNVIRLEKNELHELDESYTKLLANEISKFIQKHDLDGIDAICSHGHTVFHQPENGLTFQIGNLSILSKYVNTKVVCDFRTQDVELGGQGAPLVPIGDKLLFSQFNYCINLGGFANISFDENNQRIAFDICPVNIVMNHYTRQINLDFDNEGKLARSGKINIELLTTLNKLDFYSLKHPKSLGLEWVESRIIPLINSFELSIADVLRTFVEHVAIQITNQFHYILYRYFLRQSNLILPCLPIQSGLQIHHISSLIHVGL